MKGEWISHFVTLERGDIIGTALGTSFSTKIFLRDGEAMECEIEGIGRLQNQVPVEEAVYRTR